MKFGKHLYNQHDLPESIMKLYFIAQFHLKFALIFDDNLLR